MVFIPGCKTFLMGVHLLFFEHPERWNAALEDYPASIG